MLLGGVAGIDVAEIAGRHGEGDRPLRRAELQRGPEVVDDLRHHAGEVDRVHRRQRMAVAEGEIVEAGLGEVLAVVERAVRRRCCARWAPAPSSSGGAAPRSPGRADAA